jgi:hypothetical protein
MSAVQLAVPSAAAHNFPELIAGAGDPVAAIIRSGCEKVCPLFRPSSGR